MDDADIRQTAEQLKKLPAGFVPYPIFEQIARIVALPILEIIPLRRADDGRTEVLLIERAADDPLWPGALHTPGTVIRATDVHTGETPQNWQALERVLRDELMDTKVGPPQYVGSLLHESKRGVEQAQLYWVEVLDETPKAGAFYDVNDLPAKLIDSQTRFIQLAAQKFAGE